MDRLDIEIVSTLELVSYADGIVRSGPTIYIDASVRNGVYGIGVVRALLRNVCRSRPIVTLPILITIRQEETCLTLSAELKAI